MSILFHRQIHRRLAEIWKNNPELQQPSVFYSFLDSTYSTYMTVAVRRLADRTKGTVSLSRFLDDLHSHASLLTRAWFVSREQEDDLKPAASRLFNRYAGRCGACVSAEIVQRDINDLRSIACDIVHFANQHVTHVAANPTAMAPTYRAVDASVDRVFRILRRYFLLVKFVTLPPDEPQLMDNWAIFTIPWVKPSSGT